MGIQMYALGQHRLGDNMKIKLIDKEKPITEMFCFKFKGYDSALIETINSGKQVEVERIPKQALEYVEEIKKQTKKSKGE